MRRSSRRVFRRSGARKRNFVWVTALRPQFQLTQGGTVFDEVVLVSKFDWARDATQPAVLEKGCVLHRIVGDVFFFADADAIASIRSVTRTLNTFGVLKRDEDDLNPLDVAVDALSESWLQMTSREIVDYFDPTPTLATHNGEVQAHIPVDIKVKRKLTSDETINLCFLTTRLNLGTDISASFQLGALLEVP